MDMRASLRFLGLVSAVLIPVVAQADQNKPSPAATEEYHVGLHGPDIALFANIPLEVGQRSQIHEIMSAYQQQARPMAAQLRAAEEQLRQLMLAPGVLDTQNALTLEQSVTQLNGQLDDLALDALAEIRSHLTPTQLAGAQAAYLQRRALRQQALQSAGKN
jgi:Spy/CpxP family protein refolding chaperone